MIISCLTEKLKHENESREGMFDLIIHWYFNKNYNINLILNHQLNNISQSTSDIENVIIHINQTIGNLSKINASSFNSIIKGSRNCLGDSIINDKETQCLSLLVSISNYQSNELNLEENPNIKPIISVILDQTPVSQLKPKQRRIQKIKEASLRLKEIAFQELQMFSVFFYEH